MHLIDDLALRRQPAPRPVRPAKTIRVDDLRRAMRTVRLRTRRRIGKRLVATQAERVARAWPRLRVHATVIAIAFRIEGKCFTVDDDIDTIRLRRPYTEMHSIREDLGADRKPSRYG